MDYEKAYKESFNVAKCLHEAGDTTTKKQIERLFPQLAESEDERNWKKIKRAIRGFFTNPIDANKLLTWLERQKKCVADSSKTSTDENERIRKALINYFKSYDTLVGENWNGIECDDVIAYLEKQKEPENISASTMIPSCWNTDSLEGKDRWHKVEDSLPDNTREVLCKDAIGNYFIGRYYSNGIWEISMYDDCDKSNEDNPPVVMWIDIPSEKQKEQGWMPTEGEMGVLYKLCYLSNQISDDDDTELTRLYQDLKREYFNGHSFENMFPKQKEPHYTKRNALFDECVKNCDPKTVEEVNKRVDDIMDMPELSAFEQALTNFIGYWEDDEERWPSKFVKKHGKHILDMAREELQKEQKSFNDTQEYLKGVDRVQNYKELTKFEKGFDRIADTYAHRKNKDGYNQPWYTKERAAEMLYWAKEELELQKEQKPIAESKRLANEVIEYLTRCGYSPVLKDDSKKGHFHIDIPRHEDDFWLSEEYKHCRSVLGEYYMEGDYGGDTYTLYVWREKKAQKPRKFKLGDKVHWHGDGTNVITITGFRDDAYLTDSAYGPILFCDEDNWERIEQKPAEWSEEDEDMLNSCISSIEEAKENRYAYKETDGDTSYDHEIAWLKLLRNRVGKEFLQPHWKPSEEQMKALERASTNEYLSANQFDILVSLYEQLKSIQ